jgi:hypothetical protein
MRQILTITTICAFVLGTMPGPAWADSPHFLYATSSISTSTGALTVSFKDAGLGTGTTSIQITLSVTTATGVYQCFNNGGQHPKAGNKTTVSTALTTTGTFPVRNGSTTSSLTVGPPPVTNGFSCPSGQSLYLQSITYSGINVSDATGNTLEATSDPISSGAIHILIS